MQLNKLNCWPREFPYLCNPEVHRHVYKRLSLIQILCQFYLLYIITSYFSTLEFYSSVTFLKSKPMSRSLKSPLSSMFFYFSFYVCLLYVSPIKHFYPTSRLFQLCNIATPYTYLCRSAKSVVLHIVVGPCQAVQ
jgi:hypothetical protein